MGTGGGQGVAVNRSSGARTYMKMGTVGVGQHGAVNAALFAARILALRPEHGVALERLGEVARRRRQAYELLTVIDRRIAVAERLGDDTLADLQAEPLPLVNQLK